MLGRFLLGTVLLAACTTHIHRTVILVEDRPCAREVIGLGAGDPESAVERRARAARALDEELDRRIDEELRRGPVGDDLDLRGRVVAPSGPVTPSGSPIAVDLDDDPRPRRTRTPSVAPEPPISTSPRRERPIDDDDDFPKLKPYPGP
jgi:hypothetical protein